MRKLTAAVALLLVAIAGCGAAAPGQRPDPTATPPPAAGAGNSTGEITEQQAIAVVFKRYATSWPGADTFPSSPGQVDGSIAAGGKVPTRLPATFATAVKRTAAGYVVTLTARWREGVTDSFVSTDYAVSGDGAQVAVAGTERDGHTVPPQIRK